MKRIVALFIAALLAVIAVGCGRKPDGPSANASDAPGGTQQAGPADTNDGTGNGSGNTSGAVLDGSRLGVLQALGENGRSRIKGLVIASGSGHHEYPAVEELMKDGYKTEGLCSEFFYNEWFEVYGDVEGDTLFAYVLPNDPNADYSAMTDAQLSAANDALDYPVFAGPVTPDPESNGLLFSAYVNEEAGKEPALYNVIFTDGSAAIYVVQLNIVPLSE